MKKKALKAKIKELEKRITAIESLMKPGSITITSQWPVTSKASPVIGDIVLYNTSN